MMTDTLVDCPHSYGSEALRGQLSYLRSHSFGTAQIQGLSLSWLSPPLWRFWSGGPWSAWKKRQRGVASPTEAQLVALTHLFSVLQELKTLGGG